MTKTRFDDPWTSKTTLSYTVTKVHESFESEIQQVDVFEAEDFGTVLALGGVTNVTDRDESSYHELLGHVPMLAHPNPRRVLVVGGGDGGTLREVLRHPQVEEAVLVDIDGEVIRCAKQYFPGLAEALDHPKATVIVGDGLAYVAEAAKRGEQFDVVLIDSTDPVDGAVELFTDAFYRSCAEVLGDDGILVPQSDSPVFCIDRVHAIYTSLSKIYRHVRPYVGQTVMYPGGFWMFIAASQTIDAAASIGATPRLAQMEPELRYLGTELLPAVFKLPLFIRRGLEGAPKSALPSLCDTPPVA
ncbi:MAG: spermidine synthase [Bradymonadia bacterium]|jgi:spermidine synthase